MVFTYGTNMYLKESRFHTWFGSIVMNICNIFVRSCFWIPAFDPHLVKMILGCQGLKVTYVCIVRDQLKRLSMQ